MKYVDLIVQTLNLILPTSSKLHCLCTILADTPPPKNKLETEEKFSGHKISFKGDGFGRDGNDTIFLHLSSTADATTMSPFSPYASLIMPTMWNFSC